MQVQATKRIYQILRDEIEQKVYPPGSKFPSEADLAWRFEVSKLTMNKIVALLVQDGLLIRGVRGAGTRVAERIKLTGNKLAFFIQLSPYSMRVLKGALAECNRSDYQLIVESPEIENWNERIQLAVDSGVQGIICMGYGIPVVPDDVNTVCVDLYNTMGSTRKNFLFVNSDNFHGGQLMMEEIFRRGHRKILIFSTERYVISSNAPVSPRISGFHAVMKENGVTDFAKRTYYGHPGSRDDAKYFLKHYLKRYPDTTLIAADSDGSAELLATIAREVNVDCPGKIALTGFGDVTSLPIASVDQNPEFQGTLAVRMLSSLMQSPQMETASDPVETTLARVESIPIILS